MLKSISYEVGENWLALLAVAANAICPKVKTSMESWDWSPLSSVSAEFVNTTTTDADHQWTVNLCENVYSNLHDYGSFQGGSGSIKFHQPSDTFYMMFENGDRGDGCETTPRQADVYIHCQGCPSYLLESNPACTLESSPCICAAYDTGCIGEVHMAANCPVGTEQIYIVSYMCSPVSWLIIWALNQRCS